MWEVITLAAGLIFSLLLVKFLPYFFETRVPYEIIILIHFLCGVFVLSAVGMVFEEDSRIGGLLLASISIPLLYYFESTGRIIIGGLLVGIGVGCLLDLYVILKNRFDALAGISRTFLTGLFIIFIVYLSYGLFMELPSLYPIDIYRFITVFVSVIVLYVILLKKIVGINGEVFIFGPSRSGKSYSMVALHDQVVRSFGGYLKDEVIISSENMGEHRLADMIAKVEKGDALDATEADEMGIYTLAGKRMKASPVEITLIDYGGVQLPNINPEKYRESIAELSKRTEKKEAETEARVGSIEFLEELKEVLKKGSSNISYADVTDFVVPSYLYKRLKNAGKIIFLIDGDDILDFHESGRENLTKLFGHFGRIMEMLGNNKKYAMVVTKTDCYKDLTNILENSEEAEEIEKEIYQILTQLTTFKALEHRANKSTMHFYTVSVDATANCRTPQQIYPWRFDKIAKFAF
ncbi:MAG: hypothetical protein CHKLHMKO_00596 [Candidatus Argoarchaeum ethanivorans]|uniref:Uncharacterized protein n=1 Tax=Candidatus Argoarchaeum ethanivorans TaxID=2608793 RepID=A0A811THN5_9EURY|nr:MAG: hypothetical protein CHKLHMKO_00596 [Candidatus Argoarchaeum ethanivorans]